MFREKTAIILGAGSSCHFGIPLGQKLNGSILGDLNDVIAKNARNEYWDHFSGLSDAEALLSSPTAYLLSRMHNLPDCKKFLNGQLIHNQLQGFSDSLGEQTNLTIDQFLHENPSFRQIGKLCIAAHILRNMFDKKRSGQQVVRKAFEVKQFSGNPNWYAQLANFMRDDADNAQTLESENNLSVITFNYDTSLELFFEKQLANTELHKGADWKKCVQIFHVYGSITDVGQNLTNVPATLMSSAKNIVTIDEKPGEGTDSRLSSIRSGAIDALSTAKRVFILGFGFHRQNLELLKASTTLSGQKTFCLNYDNNALIDRTLTDWGVPTENIRTNMEISLAIEQGFFDLQP